MKLVHLDQEDVELHIVTSLLQAGIKRSVIEKSMEYMDKCIHAAMNKLLCPNELFKVITETEDVEILQCFSYCFLSETILTHLVERANSSFEESYSEMNADEVTH